MKIQSQSPQSTRNQLRGSLWLSPHGDNLGVSQSRVCSRPPWIQPPIIIPQIVPLTKVCRAMFRAGGVSSWEYGVLGPDGDPAGDTLNSEWTGANPGPDSATQDFAVAFDATSKEFSCRLGPYGNTPSTYTVPTGTLDDPDRLADLVLIVHLSSYPGSTTILDGAELTIDGGTPETLDELSQTTYGDTTRTLSRYLARGFTLTGQIRLAWDNTKPTQSRYWVQIGPND